jgi:hypothetical protein
MAAGEGVTLDRLVEADSAGPADEPAMPPAPPAFPPPLIALGTPNAEFGFPLSAAYSPVRFLVSGLPEGLAFDPASGEIRGRVAAAGGFTARITASNPAGETTADLAIQIKDERFFAILTAPASCAVGSPAQVRFQAYDATGDLDFIDVTDLTAGRQLDRLVVAGDERERWNGRYVLSFDTPGPRSLLFRFVRYDREARPAYTFIDRRCDFKVSP